MSGGTFDYVEFRLQEVQDKLQKVINGNDGSDPEVYANNYKPETIKALQEIVQLVQIAQISIHRADYLIAGDDSEESFHKNLTEEIQKCRAS